MTNLFRRKTKAAILLALLGLIPLGFVACSEDYKFEPAPIPGVAFDPSKPVEVAGIFPDSGGYLTPFIIKGSNFGTDTAKIKVYPTAPPSTASRPNRKTGTTASPLPSTARSL